MKIRISSVNCGGYKVEKWHINKWKYWLPKPSIDCRGDEYYDYYKTVKSAKNAAIKAKKLETSEKYIYDI
jgi:hypothetical protein